MGWECTSFPVIEIIKTNATSLLRTVANNFKIYHIALFVSANAVTYGLRWLKQNHLNWPQGILIGAVGKNTAKALAEQGSLRVDLAPEQKFDSEALLALNGLKNIQNKNIIIFRGNGGREHLANTLRARGASVDYAEVYERRRPAGTIASILSEKQRKHINIAVSTSNEGLKNLHIMTEEAIRPWLLDLHLVVLSSRAVVAAKQLGFKHQPLIAAQASNMAILETIKKMSL